MKPRSKNGNGRASALPTTIIGYARCSTQGQDLAPQIAELKAAGATRVFAEKESGARSDRPQLRRAINSLTKGDTLLVSRLDRLARSMRDLLNVLHEVGERGASFKSLHDPWADSTSAHGKLMLTILGGLAEFERSLIIARTSEGRARAKAAGVRFGRPFALSPFQRAEAAKRREAGEPLSLIAASYGCSARTIMRLGVTP
jgi:DNA invertase Pin-like site-specific DNA recombinase